MEAIESGVFRSDLPLKFKLKPQAVQVGAGLSRDIPSWVIGLSCNAHFDGVQG